MEFANESDITYAIEKKVSPYSLQQDKGTGNGNIANSSVPNKAKEKVIEAYDKKVGNITDNTTKGKTILHKSTRDEQYCAKY